MPAMPMRVYMTLTLRNHPIGVNQTTYGDATNRGWPGARPGLPYFVVQLLPPPAVRPAGAKGQHRRRLHLPQRRRHRRHGRLHVLRQPQLQPQPPAAAGRHPRPDRPEHRADAAALPQVPRLPGLLSAGDEHLRAGRATAAVYEEALSHPQVVGLAIGTRPDCVPDEVLDLARRARRPTRTSVRRVRHADDPRPLARLDEPRPSSRRDARRGRAQPRPRLRNRRPRRSSACPANRTPTCWPRPAKLAGSASTR